MKEKNSKCIELMSEIVQLKSSIENQKIIENEKNEEINQLKDSSKRIEEKLRMIEHENESHKKEKERLREQLSQSST